MSTKYPSNFPPANAPGFTGTNRVGLGRTSVPAALAKQRKYFNAPKIELTVTFGMTNDTYTDWFEWIRANGDNWFDLPVVSHRAPVDILSTHRVRTMSPVELVKQGDNWVDVSVEIELVPGDAEDPFAARPSYDWIVAGTPAAPSADDIQAGSPASPSTGGAIAPHLYYW